MKRLTMLAAVSALVVPAITQAAVITAGELVVDLRNTDLDGATTTWVNNDSTGDTVGNFGANDGSLNIATGISDGTHSASYALNVQAAGDMVTSALTVPASLQGNSSRSVEAWVYLTGAVDYPELASWGDTSRHGGLAAFGEWRCFSGYYGDMDWDTKPQNLQGEWLYLAWTWDGSTMTGYQNGAVDVSGALNYDGVCDTVETLMSLGGQLGTDGGQNMHTGYIADFRVHTGTLSAEDVTNNFGEGIYAIPEPATLGLIGFFGAGMLFVRRRFKM